MSILSLKLPAFAEARKAAFSFWSGIHFGWLVLMTHLPICNFWPLQHRAALTIEIDSFRKGCLATKRA